MLLYGLIILFGIAILTLANALAGGFGFDWYWILLVVIGYVVAEVALDGLIAFLIRRLPERMVNYEKPIYQMGVSERKFFDRLKIRKWKEHVPELGSFTSFHKDKVEKPHDNAYISRFILEARYGILIHLWSVPFGFLAILFDPTLYMGLNSPLWLSIGLPVCVINAILIVVPAFILRYNMRGLMTIYNYNKMVEEKKNGSQSADK